MNQRLCSTLHCIAGILYTYTAAQVKLPLAESTHHANDDFTTLRWSGLEKVTLHLNFGTATAYY